jgi:hypothetical protein
MRHVELKICKSGKIAYLNPSRISLQKPVGEIAVNELSTI